MKKTTVLALFVLCLAAAAPSFDLGQAATSKLTTNKDKLLVTAVQGKIAPGRIKTKIDPHANTAYFLGLRPKPRS